MAPPNRLAVDRFKTQLKLSINRLVLLQKKLTAQSLAARKEIAELLKANKTDQAITKVRYIVRDDFLVEAMEIVQSFCDDLLKSTNLIASSEVCDEFIMEQAKSVIYASTRLDVPELAKVRDLLVEKFTRTILPDREVGVYPRLVLKLAMSNPERKLCEKYLEAIADSFGIDWATPEDETPCDLKDQETQLNLLNSSTSSHSLTSIQSEKHHIEPPQIHAPLPMEQNSQTKQSLPDFDEFTRRFEALRKK